MYYPVPDDMPDLDDSTLYKVTVDAFQDISSSTDCTQDFVAQASGNVLGSVIKAWLANHLECHSPYELIAVTGFTAQRLIKVETL